MARVLGVDFGEKRIGLAISDEKKKIAFPYKTIQGSSLEKAVQALQEIVEEEKVEEIVFGLPLTLKGKDSKTTKKARQFFNCLKKAVSADIVLKDERFSSKMAKKALSFKNKKVSKEVIDQEAARIVLEDFLKGKQTSVVRK